MSDSFDAIVIGAGAAGLFCAGMAGQMGVRVLLLDHAAKVAEKIRISGGGRCNFTNRDAGPANFVSQNPHFCHSALARYTAADFIALVQRHRIAFHEKHKGQLFCDDSSEQIISMLLRECQAGSVVRRQPCAVHAVRRAGELFEVDTDAGTVRAPKLVVACGGPPIPKIGATDFAYRLARQFGLRVVEPRPALVPLTFDAAEWAPFAPLAGVSVPVRIAAGSGARRGEFLEDLLFTHRGLSGPAVLQASTYWAPGQALTIDLSPAHAVEPQLLAAKSGDRRRLATVLATHLPQRLADAWTQRSGLPADRPLADLRDRDLGSLAASLHDWSLTPSGTEGWKKAEVASGGVDTRDLSSKTMEARSVPGLYVIGEAMDVTGWLGGYNFQWAWSSAAACARALAQAKIDL